MSIALSDLVSTTVAASSASPTVPGFGKTLFLANEVPANFPAAPQTYTNLSGLISAGFATTSTPYLALQAGFSANPAEASIMVARRNNKTTQVVTLTVQAAAAVAGATVGVTVTTPTGVSTALSYTVPVSSTTSTVATALAALIAAAFGFTATAAAGAVITVASPATGTLNGFSNWTSNLYFADVSADPGIAADIATALSYDNTWYGLDIDNHSKAEILAAAAVCEANKKLFVAQSSDTTVPDNTVTTDVASSVQTAAYHYTAILYNGNNTKAFAGLEWQSGRFGGSPTPGNDSWMYNTLPGIFVDSISETQFATLGNKFATAYVSIQGVNVTASGGIANTNSGGRSGSGEFLDTRRFLDWLLAQIQIGLYTALLGPGKVAYTDKGITLLANAVLGALQRGEAAGGLVALSSVVSQPTAASAGTSDRGNRILRNLNWQAQLAGAVHLVVSSGTVTT
jgi:hypothetical protein